MMLRPCDLPHAKSLLSNIAGALGKVKQQKNKEACVIPLRCQFHYAVKTCDGLKQHKTCDGLKQTGTCDGPKQEQENTLLLEHLTLEFWQPTPKVAC